MTRTYGNFTDFIDFSRASSGTYLGSDGLLKTAADNVPRVEYDANGQVKGLLIEEARTNSASESNGWAGAGFQRGASTTATANYGISPDGTQNSTRVQFSAGAVSENRVEDIISGTVASLTHTVSFWMRSTDGSSQVARLKCTHGGVTDYFSSDQTVTGEWQRFSFTQAFGAGGTGSVVAGVVNGSSGGSADIEVYGLQVELNASFPTSLIPTSGATATRSADIADIATANFGYNPKAGTVVVEVDPPTSGNRTAFDLYGASGNERWQVRTTGSQYQFYSGTNGAGPFGAGGGAIHLPQNDSNAYKAAIALKENDAAFSVNGSGVGTDTTITVPKSEKLNLGFYSANEHLNGHIKSIKYIPRRNSNTQLQEFTS